jgi:hypothetical protein
MGESPYQASGLMSDKISEQVPSVIWRGLFLFGHVAGNTANKTALQQFEA